MTEERGQRGWRELVPRDPALLLPALAPLAMGLLFGALVGLRGELMRPLGVSAVYLGTKLVGDAAFTLLVAALCVRIAGPRAGGALALVCSALYAAFIAGDVLVYLHGFTVVEPFHLRLVRWDYLWRFADAQAAVIVAVLAGAVIGAFLLWRRVAQRLSFLPMAALGLVLGAVFTLNPPRFLERHNLAHDDGPPALVRQEQMERLDVLFRNPVTLLTRAIFDAPPWRIEPVGALDAYAPLIAGLGILPLAHPLPATPAAAHPWRFDRVLLVTTESLSLDLLGGYNARLPESLAPFYNRPEVKARMLLRYFTTHLPTWQGISVSLASHPDPFLVAEAGGRLSLVHLLREHGFLTTFIKGDSLYYAPEAPLLAQLGFERVIGREQLQLRPGAAQVNVGVGVADRIVYEAALDALDAAAQKNQRAFIELLGVDTHPGGRNVYPALGYPEPPVDLAQFGDAARVVRDAYWHDSDMIWLFAQLERRKLWDEHLLVVLTADHCRPYDRELESLPGYAADSNCRIPLVLLTPAPLPLLNTERLSSQIDLAPTLADLLDLRARRGWWGKSLLSGAGPDVAVISDARTLTLLSEGGTKRISVQGEAPSTQPMTQENALHALYNTAFIEGFGDPR